MTRRTGSGSARCASCRSRSATGRRPISGQRSATSAARPWAAVSDFGGKAEVNANCTSYGGPFCTYPWFALNSTFNAFTFGADYPGTKFDYGQADQYQQTALCGGPFGPDSTFCDTVLNPTQLAPTK
jgi:hypothetical protein